MNTQRRSETPAGVQLDWVGGVDQEGVGARQARVQAGQGGGGYLDECNASEVRGMDQASAKFRELADMGLPGVWLNVVREIGYDPFMAMWRVLDQAVELRSESDSMIEVQLRRYGSFRRYQRNRFIESLAVLGFRPDQIRERVAKDLGEKVSYRHIARLAGGRRVKP